MLTEFTELRVRTSNIRNGMMSLNITQSIFVLWSVIKKGVIIYEFIDCIYVDQEFSVDSTFSLKRCST